MKISGILQIRPVEAEFSLVDERTDGRTDRQRDKHDELILALRNIANAPKNQPVHAE